MYQNTSETQREVEMRPEQKDFAWVKETSKVILIGKVGHKV